MSFADSTVNAGGVAEKVTSVCQRLLYEVDLVAVPTPFDNEVREIAHLFESLTKRVVCAVKDKNGRMIFVETTEKGMGRC